MNILNESFSRFQYMNCNYKVKTVVEEDGFEVELLTNNTIFSDRVKFYSDIPVYKLEYSNNLYRDIPLYEEVSIETIDGRYKANIPTDSETMYNIRAFDSDETEIYNITFFKRRKSCVKNNDVNFTGVPNITLPTGNIVDVTDYGAIPNDLNFNNSGAFTNAISNANAGDIVYVPTGSYYFDENTIFPMKDGVSLIGDGLTCSVLVGEGTIVGNAVSNLIVADLSLMDNSIALTESENIYIKNVHSTAVQGNTFTGEKFLIENCLIDNAEIETLHSVIRNSIMKKYNMSIRSGLFQNNWVIDESRIRRTDVMINFNYINAILILPSTSNMHVNNNIFYQGKLDIRITASNITVVDNTFNLMDVGVTVAGEDHKLKNNIFTNCKTGVILNESDGCLLSYNKFINGEKGIVINEEETNFSLYSNYFFDVADDIENHADMGSNYVPTVLEPTEILSKPVVVITQDGEVVNDRDLLIDPNVMLQITTNARYYQFNSNKWHYAGFVNEVPLTLVPGKNFIFTKNSEELESDMFHISMNEMVTALTVPACGYFNLPPDLTDQEIHPIERAFINRETPWKNFVGEDNLRLRGDKRNKENNQMYYLKFDINNIAVNEFPYIYLEIHTNYVGSDSNTHFYSSEEYEWNENDITWDESKYHFDDVSQIVIEDDVKYLCIAELGSDTNNKVFFINITEQIKEMNSDIFTIIATAYEEGHSDMNGNQANVAIANLVFTQVPREDY